jgi:hypothetical protein
LLKHLAFLALVACSNDKKAGESAKPAADPWASAPAADDPWKAGNEPSLPTAEPATAPPTAPPTEPEAPAQASSLAGRYECFQQRSSAVSGQLRSTFVASALGAFEIDPDGTYRSASYASKGDGRIVQGNDNRVRFEGGPYPGSPGVTGTNSTGFYIRFSGDLTTPPVADMKFNEHVCYRRSK